MINNIQEKANALAQKNGYTTATYATTVDGLAIYVPQADHDLGMTGLPPVITARNGNVKLITGQEGFDLYGKVISNPKIAKMLADRLEQLLKNVNKQV